MKKYFVIFFFTCSLSIVAQQDRIGISVGATNYVTNTDLLFSKSSTGYTFGVFATKEFNWKRK